MSVFGGDTASVFKGEPPLCSAAGESVTFRVEDLRSPKVYHARPIRFPKSELPALRKLETRLKG